MSSILGRRALRLLIAFLMGVGLVGVAGPASASSAPSPRPTYLALGDSVPFGFRGNLPPVLYRFPQLFVGYPQVVGPTLGLSTVNASCPGETTTSFVTGKGSNGCEDNVDGGSVYRGNFPLHVHYRGTQLDYALEALEGDANVRLVTVMLGANDAFLCQKTTPDQCVSELPGVVAKVGTNLAFILGRLRGAYDGKIVVVTYYALDYDSADPNFQGTVLLNQAIRGTAAKAGAVVADGFGAFQQRALQAGGSSVAVGLLLASDVHPTQLGQVLLARAVDQAVGH
ncbi:MAG: hypothetical protein JWO98_4 [Frankiales bacterium]|nr:hypothetical protein [Frankiales bacterium]